MTSYTFSPQSVLGATYDCGNYGADTYNNAQACGTTTSSGLLANTGMSVWLPLAIGTLLIVGAISVVLYDFIKKRKARANS